jgi:hypothetical protein
MPLLLLLFLRFGELTVTTHLQGELFLKFLYKLLLGSVVFREPDASDSCFVEFRTPLPSNWEAVDLWSIVIYLRREDNSSWELLQESMRQ